MDPFLRTPGSNTVAGPRGSVLVRPQISPDGRTIAFAAFLAPGEGHIYLASDSGNEAAPLEGGEYAWPSGDFSPDGQQLLATEIKPPKTLKLITVGNGHATAIADQGNSAADWGPHDTIIMGSDTGLWLVPLSGGKRTQLTSVKAPERGHWLPRMLPGGRAVLFYVVGKDRDHGQVGVYDFRSGEQKTLIDGSAPAFARSGHLVFWHHGGLWAAAFEADTLSITGKPVLVVERVGADYMGDAWYSLSPSGALAYILPRDLSKVAPDTVPEVILIDGWFEELNRVAPAAR